MNTEITDLRARLESLNDHAEISALIHRFFASLDDRATTPLDADWAAGMFTADVTVSYPIGDLHGAHEVQEALAAGMRWFGPTQHVTSDHLVTLDGDHATLRWNAIQTHTIDEPGADLFVSAGKFTGEAERTAAGWRFHRMSYTLTWSTGRPPGSDE